MTLDELKLELDKAKEAHMEAVASYNIHDLLNGNREKDALVEKAFNKVESIKMTIAVREDAKKFKEKYMD